MADQGEDPMRSMQIMMDLARQLDEVDQHISVLQNRRAQIQTELRRSPLMHLLARAADVQPMHLTDMAPVQPNRRAPIHALTPRPPPLPQTLLPPPAPPLPPTKRRRFETWDFAYACGAARRNGKMCARPGMAACVTHLCFSHCYYSNDDGHRQCREYIRRQP